MRAPHAALVLALAAALGGIARPARADTEPAKARLSVGLLEVSSSGPFRPEELTTVEDILVTALDSKGHFKVTGRADLPDLEARKQKAGCHDDACLAQVAAAAGMDLLATVHLSRLEELKIVTVNVLSARTGAVLARSHQGVKQDSELLGAADLIAAELRDAIRQDASVVPAPAPSPATSAPASPAAPTTEAVAPPATTAPPPPQAAPATTSPPSSTPSSVSADTAATASASPPPAAIDLSARPPAKPAVPPAPMTLKRKVGIGIIVGGGVVFVAGCLVGIEVTSSTSALQGSIHPLSTATSMENSINTLVNVANALFGIGGALAATGVAVAF